MDPALNGTAYGGFKADKHQPEKTLREIKISQLTAAMDAFCDHAALQFPLFKEFDKFRSTFITQKTNKDKAAPTHWFFDRCDELGVIGENLLLEMRARLLYVKTHLFSFAREKVLLLKKEQKRGG